MQFNRLAFPDAETATPRPAGATRWFESPAFLVFLLGVGVFVFFHSFLAAKLTPLSTEILSAVLGATITVLITTMLLDKQTVLEARQKQFEAHEVAKFDRLLDLFRSFLQLYVRTAADGELTEDELADLEELALTIALLTKEEESLDGVRTNIGEEICRFVLQLQLFGLATEVSTERERELYTEHLADASHPLGSGPIELQRPVAILNGMRIALAVANAGDAPMRPDSFAQRLLDYHAYRRSTLPELRAA